jgi:predicted Mrr-cat superfamily restriction endonuclease
VEYRGVFAQVSSEDYMTAEHTAAEILSSKYKEWEYEREVRILLASEWYKLEKPVKRVIVGHRMQPAVVKALQIICERKGIALNRTGIGDEGIDADQVDPLDD